MKFSAAVVCTLTAIALMALADSAAAQQAYPNKPIRFIVPYAPGSPLDILARPVGQKLTESWGQPVIVDNRPGGTTIIATEALLKSLPDGYTLLLIASAHVLIPQLLPVIYDPIKDFAPVATIGSTEYILVLNLSIPANNLREFIALAKSKPGQLNYASGSSGGATHLAAELFNIMAGVKIVHIPYKASMQSLTDLIAGRVQMFFGAPIITIPLVKSGRIKAIAISGETRLPALPEVPTFTEAGLPGFDIKVWFGVLAPGGTPTAVIDKLSAEIAKILAMPDFKTTLTSQGMDPFASTAEQFATLMKVDMAKYAKVIKAVNIKLQ